MPTKNLISKDEKIKVVNNLFEKTISWMIDLDVPGIADQREIDNMRNEGHLIYTLISKNTIIGYIKIGRGRVYILDFDRIMYFPQKDAFVIDTYIHEDYRGKKLFHYLITAVKMDLQKKGFKRLYCHIRSDNGISIAAYKKNSFSNRGLVSYKRIMWKRILQLPLNYMLN